jgi:DNA-binding HxlR family transcriptional regulator
MFTLSVIMVRGLKKHPLGRGKGVEILLALLGGPKNFSELASSVGGSFSTVELRVYEFIDAGLLRQERQDTFPPRRILELTNKGYAIAKMLKKLEEAVRERPKTLTERERWILALLHALGGEIKGSTRLQKLLFLLKREFDVVGDQFYEFRALYFGPFSAEIIEDVRGLEKAGLIDIEIEVFEPEELSEDGVIRRTYKLSIGGERIAFETFNKLPDKTKRALLSLRQFNGMPLKELIGYVYSKYPEYGTKGDA